MASRTARQMSLSARCGNILHVDRNAVVLHQCGHGGEFAVVQRDAEVNHGLISSNMRGSRRHRASTSLAQYSKIRRCSSGVNGQP